MIKQTVQYYNARFRLDEEGATAVEYGVLIALIIAVLVAIIATIGGTAALRLHQGRSGTAGVRAG
jgi:Flp pilus assembly pilin Flp